MRNLFRHNPRRTIAAGVVAALLLGLGALLIAQTWTPPSGASLRANAGGGLNSPTATTSAAQPSVTIPTATPSSVAQAVVATPSPTKTGHGLAPGLTSGGSGGISSSGSAPTPTATGAPATGPTPTGTATAGVSSPTPLSSPTPTSTSITANDAAIVVAQSGPLHESYQNFTIFFTLQNTGSSTWMIDYADYDLYCATLCGGTVNVNVSSIGPIAPGQQVTFTITKSETTTGTYYVDHPHWTMKHSGVAFGPDLTVSIYVAGFAPVLTQAAPGCNNPSGVSWAWWGTGGANSISCGGGLVMSQGASSPYLRAALTSAYGPYDSATIREYVHVHFSSVSSTAIGALMLRLPSSAGGCDGTGIGVSPNGAIYYVNINSACQISYGTLVTRAPGTDWNLESEITNGNQVVFWVNGVQIIEGGTFAAGPYAGLLTIDPTASGAPVAYSSYELDQWMT